MRKQIIASIIVILCICSSTAALIVSESLQAESGNIITTEYSHGTLIDVSDGSTYYGGEFTEELTLRFSPAGGYEFVSWTVEGTAQYTTSLNTITLTSVSGPVSITVNSRNYSTSQELINLLDVEGMAEPGDDLVLSWSFKSGSFSKTGGMWPGSPCTPLIVGDTAYVRAGGRLYALDMDSGTVLNQVVSGGSTSDYYHYISYGNGVIFDTSEYKAYDLELNYLYDLPSNLKFATYHDGYYYGCLSAEDGYYTLYKTSLDVDKDLSNNVKQNLFKTTTKYQIFAQYGQFSNVQFIGDWFVFLESTPTTGYSGYRAVTAFNIVTEESKTCELSGFTGMPWDDGWLTYYNGYFYLTAYTAGLFDGVIKGLEDKRSSIMWVKFDSDSGTFEEPNYKNIQTPEGDEFRGIASGLVIYNGRGYLNVRALGTDTLGGSDDTGSCMIAYRIEENGEPFPESATPSAMSHGGIVINKAYESEGKIYIYMIPYNASGQAIYVFTDELKDGKWVLKSTVDKLEMSRTDWCSQCIRAGPNGEMVFYVDSGYIDCYVSADRYSINVITVDGTDAVSQTGTGKNVLSVIQKMYPAASVNGATVEFSGKSYTLYGLNEVNNKWVKITDPSTGAYSGTYKNGVTESHFRYVVMLENSSSMTLSEDGEKGWYYFDGEYKICSFGDKSSMKSAQGHNLAYLEEKPSEYSAVSERLKITRDDTVSVDMSDYGDFEYTVSDELAIKVTDLGTVLLVTGLYDSTSVITVFADGKEYRITVEVLPKTDGNKTDSKSILRGEDGETVIIESVIEQNGDITVTNKTESTVSTEGIEKITVSEIKVNNRGLIDDKIGIITECTEKVTEGGVEISDMYTYSEKYTQSLDGGISVTIESSATRNNYTDQIVKTSTVSTTEYSSFTSIITETELTDAEGIKTSDSVSEFKSKVDGLEFLSENGTVKIDAVNYDSEDLSEIINVVASSEKATVCAGAKIDAKAVSAAADAGISISLAAGDNTIHLGTDAVSNLSGKDLQFSVAGNVALNAKQQGAAGNAQVFSIVLSSDSEEQHAFGKFTVVLDCGMEEDNGKELKVWRIEDSGEKTYMNVTAFKDGKVTFEADHLSYYAVGFEAESSEAGDSENADNGFILYLGIGLVFVLVLLGAAFYLRSKKQKA